MKSRRSLLRFEDLPSSPGRYELELGVGSGRRARNVALWWQRGAEPGPCLAITSMVHGDEFEGFAATRVLWERINKQKLHGSILIIPICNPWAAEAATRTTPAEFGGGNLARSFPGISNGTPTQRLAWRLWRVLRGADTLLDFHSGGAGYDYAPLAGFYREADAPLAACFPMPYLWKIPMNRGVLSLEFSRLRKPAVGCEYSGEARLSPKGAQAYVKGALAMMGRLGILRGHLAKGAEAGSRSLLHKPQATGAGKAQRLLKQTGIQITLKPGWFFTRLKIGDRIRKGDSVGTWCGENLRSREIRSSYTGIVIGLRTLPRVQGGEGLLLVGRA